MSAETPEWLKNLRMRPADTTPEAWKDYCDRIDAMTPDERWEEMFRINTMGRRIAEDGIRMRHPEYTDEQVRLARCRMFCGDEVFRKFFPDIEIEI